MRILYIKQKGSFLFGQADIRPHAEGILNALFKVIESGQTPQQIAANDHLMKCESSGLPGHNAPRTRLTL